MTKDEVRAAAERLVEFHERFAPLFGKEQAQDNASSYIKGLMVCPERKSIEPIALNVGDGKVSALQKFINIAPWGHDDVQTEIQDVFVEELVPTAADSPIGVVGVVDESGFAKKGGHSAGVGRQHNGRLGKKDNGQVVWQDNSPGKNILDGQWSSPLVIETSGRAQVVVPQGDGWLRSFEALTGKLLWKFDINAKTSKWSL